MCLTVFTLCISGGNVSDKAVQDHNLYPDSLQDAIPFWGRALGNFLYLLHKMEGRGTPKVNMCLFCADDLASDFLETVTAQVEFRSHRARLHRQMLALLPRFCFSEKFNKQLRNLSSQAASEGKDRAAGLALAYQEIASNITAFCRAVITESSECVFVLT